MDYTQLLAPVLFQGGSPTEYAVEILGNGGFGTRHLLSDRVVPHVLSKVGSDSLKQLPVPGSPAPLVQFAATGLQAAQPWLAAANLGVGLLNLGVCAWTAWKVHRMDKKLDHLTDAVEQVDGKVNYVADMLEASVYHLDGLIRQNALMLGLIIEHQARIEEGLLVLYVAMQEGFQGVHEALSSAEAKRRSDELERQMRTLFAYYKLCSREMQAGRVPPLADLRQIVDVATKLIAWLDTRLNTHAPGSPERLPLMLARAYALRLEIEARAILDDAPTARQEEVSRFLDVIRAEVQGIVEGTSIYDLATARRLLVEQYIYLYRALNTPATIISFEDGRSLPFYPATSLVWDDGLGRVRELVAIRAEVPPPRRLELRALEEHRAWESLTGLPQGASDDSIEMEDIKGVLGLPTGVDLAESTLRDILSEASFAKRDSMQRIEKEVG